MKKKFFCFIVLICIVCSVCAGIEVSAKEISLPSIGTYVIHVPVNKTTKVYIEPKLVSFVESTGVTVSKEEKKFLGIKISTKYYYYADKYVDRIVGSREIVNDVDSLIFMVNELELEAKRVEEKNYKNLVLGYIRSISKSYDSGYSGNWKQMAGDTPTSFINIINADTSHGIRFNEYFAQYVDSDSYNSQIHGEIDDKYYRSTALKMKDSLDGEAKIDLIHMFACMDGIYNKTENTITLGNANMQRDIVTWNGDLQQAAKQLAKEGKEVGSEKLEKGIRLFFDGDYGASEDDIIADIDAMNITKTYIDCPDSSISNSLGAYYLLVEKNKTNRYKMFMETVLIDEEHISSASLIERFEIEIRSQFNVIKKSNGECYNCEYLSPSVFVGFGIMRSDTNAPANVGGKIPSLSIRTFVVNSFIDYIEGNI